MTLRPRNPDVALAAAFLAFHIVDRFLVNPEYQGSVAANLAGAVAMSIPLVWLRRRPLLAVLGFSAGSALNELLGATRTDEMFASVVLLIVIGYVVARNHDGARRWIPLAAAAALIGGAELFHGAGDVGFVWLMIGAGALGGGLVRNRVALTRELAERTHELEALREAHERDAVLDERRRIARELHDVVAHTVSIMVVQAGGARRQLDRNPARALAALDQVQTTGEETLRELRRLFGLLHAEDPPRGLDDLAELVARTRAAGLPVELDVAGEPRPLDADAGLAAYRLVQEALTNTLKHGGPGATARVALRWGEDMLDVRVSDTGWGAGGPRGDGSRRGLVGMRERMAAFDGQVEAGPGPDGGFEVRARLPLAREEVQLA
jgi:signal transduction histidine kinase